MKREQIEILCKYAEQMLNDAEINSDLHIILLDLAECHLNNLLKRFQAEANHLFVGYISSRLGYVKLDQNQPNKAKKTFLVALSHLVDQGNYQQDLTLVHSGLGMAYQLLGDEIRANEHFMKVVDGYREMGILKKNSTYTQDQEQEFNL